MRVAPGLFPTAAIFLLGAASCAGLDSGSWLISEQTEVELGAEYHVELLKEMPEFSGDPKVGQYVRDIGQAIVPHSHRPDLKYTFTVVESPDVNAFAVMGGYVYVTTALVKAASSGAEIAGILGHEIGHVAARHGVQGLEAYLIANGLSSLLGGGNLGEVVATSIQVGDGLIFSKDQEREADELGVEYAVAAGYNAWGIVDFFDYLDKTYGGGSSGSSAVDQAFESLGEVFSTHPPTPERIGNVKTQLGDMGVGRDASNLKWETGTNLSEIKSLIP